MITLTQEQFKSKYGNTTGFNVTSKPAPPSYFSNVVDKVGGDLANRIDRYGAIDSRTDTGALTKGVQKFGQGAGLAASTLETVVGELPGVKQVTQGLSHGMNWLVTSPYSVVKGLGDIVGQSKALQTATKLYDEDQSFKDTIDAVGNVVRLGGDIATIVDSANFTKNVTNKFINKVKTTTSNVIDTTASATKSAIGKAVENQPAEIMNRVARLNPTDENKFVQMAGKKPGEYLVETGNFGSPDQILANEAKKFTASKASVDAELEKLPGVYQDGSIEDALQLLSKKAETVSSPNVPAPFKSQVENWLAKYAQGGLDMADINGVKRLFEREVKLGYNKIGVNPDVVQKATIVDSALREWQVGKAQELGFKNISELNKQTQISKFILNKLGDKVIGQSALNQISLTDWIVLGGGSPESVAGFLTKKFFSNKAVQAKIAELLNQKEVKGLITPDTSITSANIERQVSPQGLKQLPAPEVGSPQTSIETPINQPSRKAIDSGTEVVPKGATPSKKISLQPEAKGNSTLPNSTPKFKNGQEGFINYEAMASDIKSSIIQLKKLTAKSFNKGKQVDLEGFGKWETLVSKDPKKWTVEDILTANELLKLYSK